MKKMSRALLLACMAGFAGHAAAGTISITPGSTTGSTAGGATAPSPLFIRYEQAAAGETTNSIQVRMLYDTSRIDIAVANVAPGTCSNNDATGTVILTAIDLGGGNLATGNLCQLTVTVTAGAAAALPLDLQFNAGLGDGSFDGLGDPTAPQATLTDGTVNITAGTFNYAATPATLTYNGVVGAATPAQNANIAAEAGNNGPVTFSACTFGGANAADFAMAPAPTFPLNVAAGTNVNIPITFTAGALGARTATFSCATANGTAVGGSFPITLNGTGVTNTLTTTATITFPSTLVGSPAASQNVVATAGAGNTGNVTITSCAISGANAGDFSQTPAAVNVAVAPGANVNVPVGFTPTAAGARTATLTCNLTNGPAATFVTTLNGTAAAAAPIFASSNPANGAAITALGTAGIPLTRVIAFPNTGNAAGTMTCVASAGFTVTPAGAVNINAGATGNISVAATSLAPATVNGTLDCTGSDGSVFNYTLAYTFGAAAIAQIPAVGSFGLWALFGLFAGVGMFFVVRNRA